ncbi:MAG TPA: hypothetical protein QF353_00700 [Gammaproteobacteria bacterium]|nr:hypothetical protein [Gammaproteobacteria bacterium]
MLQEDIHVLMLTIGRYTSYILQMSELSPFHAEQIVKQSDKNSVLFQVSSDFNQFYKQLKKLKKQDNKDDDIAELCKEYMANLLDHNNFAKLISSTQHNDVEQLTMLISVFLDYAFIQFKNEDSLVNYLESLMNIITKYDEHGMGSFVENRLEECNINIAELNNNLNNLLVKRYGMIATINGSMFPLASLYSSIDSRDPVLALKEVSQAYSHYQTTVHQRGASFKSFYAKVFNSANEQDFVAFETKASLLQEQVELANELLNKHFAVHNGIRHVVAKLFHNLKESYLNDSLGSKENSDSSRIKDNVKAFHRAILHPDVLKRLEEFDAVGKSGTSLEDFYENCTSHESLNFFYNLNVYIESKRIASKYSWISNILGLISLCFCMGVFGLSYSTVFVTFYKATPGLFYLGVVAAGCLLITTFYHYISSCVYESRRYKTLDRLDKIVRLRDGKRTPSARTVDSNISVKKSVEAINLNSIERNYKNYQEALTEIENNITTIKSTSDEALFSKAYSTFLEIKNYYDNEHAFPNEIYQIGDKFISESFFNAGILKTVTACQTEQDVIHLTELYAEVMTYWHIKSTEGSFMAHLRQAIDYVGSSGSNDASIADAAEVFDAVKVLERHRSQYRSELKEALKTYGLVFFKLKDNSVLTQKSNDDLIRQLYAKGNEALCGVNHKVAEALQPCIKSYNNYCGFIESMQKKDEKLRTFVQTNLENLPNKVTLPLYQLAGSSFYETFSSLHFGYLDTSFSRDKLSVFWSNATLFQRNWLKKMNRKLRSLSCIGKKYQKIFLQLLLIFVATLVLIAAITYAPEHNAILSSIPGLFKLVLSINVISAVLAVASLLVIFVGMYHEYRCHSKIKQKLSDYNYKPVAKQAFKKPNNEEISRSKNIVGDDGLSRSKSLLGDEQFYEAYPCTGRYDGDPALVLGK